jgi:hypothetical protein
MYRFRATLGRRLGGYLSIVVLVTLIAGVAMASIAAGRRTQSSYSTFLSSTAPSQLTVAVDSNSEVPSSYSAALEDRIARLPGVKRVVSLLTPAIAPLNPNGSPNLGGSKASLDQFVASPDGMFSTQDRLSLVEGRLADPGRADEAVMSVSAAHLAGLHVGQVLAVGYYTGAQIASPSFGTPRVRPRLQLNVKLVGIVELNRQVVQDDVDRSSGFVIFTPAVLRAASALSPGDRVELAPGAPVLYGLRLDRPGSRDLETVEKEFATVAPPDSSYTFNATSRVVREVELALKPESVALGAFGAIAALVALVIAILAISRQVRYDEEDRQVLRSLGAGPAVTAVDGLIGVLASVVLGSLLAVALAVVLSALAPLGPVRPVYPDPGFAFDWTVLGLGLAVLVGGLGAAAFALAYLRAPDKLARRARRTAPRGSSLAHQAESAGLPVAGVAGIRFALESGQGRTSLPVRSALVGTMLAVAVVVAALTFASGLSTLVSDPPLYGWNWNYMFSTSNDVPPQSLRTLDNDPAVAAWSGANLIPFQIDGQFVPAVVENLRAAVSPPLLSGHGLEANNQIVIGSATLAALHKHVGESVEISFGTPGEAPAYISPTPLQIVGTATFPAIGYSSLIADHPSMGTGVLLSAGIEPPSMVKAETNADPILNGPQYVFVRLRAGVGRTAGLANLQRIATAANKAVAADPRAAGNDEVAVLGVQRPAQIVNYRSIGATPVVLAAGLAVGAIIALGLTLMASVRRRRRDLALLKTLGFTQRQLSAAVLCQATVAAVMGLIVGIPLGIVIGRELWTLFARSLDAVPDPTVPVLSVLIVGIGTLVFANLVAALPGRNAAHTPIALVLRAE